MHKNNPKGSSAPAMAMDHRYFCKMHRAVLRLSPASILLALVLFTALPRTWFHHCAHGSVTWSSDARKAAVHGDTHCPVCETPYPVCDRGFQVFGGVHLALLGERVFVGQRCASLPDLVVLKLRGPPAVG